MNASIGIVINAGHIPSMIDKAPKATKAIAILNGTFKMVVRFSGNLP